jgi:murein DD-endopeptidase MepM/ murein hydrolase activator NlpD
MVIFFITLKRCSFHSLPKERLQAIKIDVEESYDNNEYQLIIKNPVDCPNRFFLSCQDEEVNKILSAYYPVLLEAKSDTSINIKGKGNLKGKIEIEFKWGNPKLAILSTNIKSLPYPKGKSYNLLQGNNSNPTHNSSMSRYAFDFTMKIGDTITSTQDGYVVTAIDGYIGWGYGDKWKSYANQVMIYDTVSHLFTMYGHLKQHGSLVEVGDFVTIGQPIALSGKTGQTSDEHLHFNVLQADNGKSGLKSYSLDSIGNYKVKELKRNQLMNTMPLSETK